MNFFLLFLIYGVFYLMCLNLELLFGCGRCGLIFANVMKRAVGNNVSR